MNRVLGSTQCEIYSCVRDLNSACAPRLALERKLTIEKAVLLPTFSIYPSSPKKKLYYRGSLFSSSLDTFHHPPLYLNSPHSCLVYYLFASSSCSAAAAVPTSTTSPEITRGLLHTPFHNCLHNCLLPFQETLPTPSRKRT